MERLTVMLMTAYTHGRVSTHLLFSLPTSSFLITPLTNRIILSAIPFVQGLTGLVATTVTRSRARRALTSPINSRPWSTLTLCGLPYTLKTRSARAYATLALVRWWMGIRRVNLL